MALGQRQNQTPQPGHRLVRRRASAASRTLRIQQQSETPESDQRHGPSCRSLPQRQLARPNRWKTLDSVVRSLYQFQMKQVLLLLAALIVFPPSTPASESGRQRFRMDFDWRFTLGDPPDAEKPTFDDKSWRELNVPHDWSIEGPWSKDNPSGSAGGYAPIGIGWYRKSFHAPSEFRERRVLLEFDGVLNHSDVWVNGRKVGHNEYGYIGFECDLTPWIRLNRDNVIAVRVDNLRQASRWYTGSGTYRHVWLIVTSPLHVANWGTFVTTSKITTAETQVSIVTTLRNDSDESRKFTLATQIIDPAGERVASTQSALEALPRSEFTTSQLFTVSTPRLWTLEAPAFYRAV